MLLKTLISNAWEILDVLWLPVLLEKKKPDPDNNEIIEITRGSHFDVRFRYVGMKGEVTETNLSRFMCQISSLTDIKSEDWKIDEHTMSHSKAQHDILTRVLKEIEEDQNAR